MVYRSSNHLRVVRGAPTRAVVCSNCANATEQQLFWWDDSFHMEFMGAHVLGRKAYGYVCPVCSTVSDQLSKEQAKSLRRR